MALLALLAMALQLLVPPGFMPARINDLPFAVVICTAKGGIAVAPGEALPGQDDSSGQDRGSASCQMVAQPHLALPAPDLRDWTRPVFFALASPCPCPAAVSPGRGVSGPPLPARGPPSLSL